MEDPDERLLPVARTAQALGMDVSVVHRLYDAVGERVRMEHLGGLPVSHLHRVDPHGWQFLVKDACGRTLAAMGLLLLSPLTITLALLVRLSSPGGIAFRQRRVGRDGRPFDVLRFRSMRLPRDGHKASEPKAGAAPGGPPPRQGRITGWAQVHGLRGQASIADRAEWDNHYIETWSLRLDVKILARRSSRCSGIARTETAGRR